jgi:kinesin family protein 1
VRFHSVVTEIRGYLIGCQNEREFNDWLYAINPLLAGQIRYAQYIKSS